MAAARDLLSQGVTPTIEGAATAAGISRTTAYRYFPDRQLLVEAAYPEVRETSLLPSPAPEDPVERLELTMDAFIDQVTLPWEPQLRAALRVALEAPREGRTPLRQGRAIGWIEDALLPLRSTHPHVDIHQLAIAIRSATGIESLIWLTDIAGLTRGDAAAVMKHTAAVLLRDALGVHGKT